MRPDVELGSRYLLHLQHRIGTCGEVDMDMDMDVDVDMGYDGRRPELPYLHGQRRITSLA
jgi:hypothetical protein